MSKKLLFGIFIILPSLLIASITDNQRKQYEELINNYDLQGPSELYTITADCDKKNIDKIESGLTGEAVSVIDYHYTLYLIIREHKIFKVEITDYEFNEEVKSCIENRTLDSIRIKSLPKKGLIPIIVKFPAFITKKSDHEIK